MIDPSTVKVGDRLFDLLSKQWIEVCNCMFFVRTRINYVREHPDQFAYEEPEA